MHDLIFSENKNLGDLMMNFKKWALSLIFACVPALGSAAHIDQLGINISLVSNDGAGNFVLQYDEYFGSDGWMWANGGGSWLYDTGGYMTGSYRFSGLENPVNLTVAGATIAATTSGSDITFQGLVDSMGVATAGFGASQVSTQYVNGLGDAALYSGTVGFSIVGYDPLQSYTISVSSTDCCYVSGSGGPSYTGSLTFDPSVVVTVPAPATLALLGLGLVGMGFRTRRAA